MGCSVCGGDGLGIRATAFATGGAKVDDGGGIVSAWLGTVSDLRGFGYDVAGEIGRAADHPFGHGLWFGIMLVSTLIPTLLHFIVLAAAPLSLLGPGREKREAWAEVLERADFDRDAAAEQEAVIAVARWQTYGQGVMAVGLGFVGVGLVLTGLYFGAAAVGVHPEAGIRWVAELAVRSAGG